MEDLAAIVMVMFVAWIASGLAGLVIALLAPPTWSRALRVTLLLVTAAVFMLLTAALFGSRLAIVGTAAGVIAAFVVYFVIKDARRS